MKSSTKFRWMRAIAAAAVIFFLFVQHVFSYPDPPCWSSVCPSLPNDPPCLWAPYYYLVQNPNPLPLYLSYCACPSVSFSDVPGEPATVGYETKKEVSVAPVAGTKQCTCNGCFWFWQPTINSVGWQADHGISPGSGQASSEPYTATFTVTQTGQLPITFNADASATDPSWSGGGSFLTSVPVLPPMRLGCWRFNGSFNGEDGPQPVTVSGVQLLSDWYDGAAKFDNDLIIPILSYRAIESDGHPNATRNVGTIRFWFKPDWNSSGSPGLTGLATLFEIRGNGPTLSIQVNNNGTRLEFVASGVTLSRTIDWTQGNWHQIVVTYSTAASILYVDGQQVGSTGPGIEIIAFPALGIDVGSSLSGNSAQNQARGWFDELETFNYPLSDPEILANYDTVSNLDTDHDDFPNLGEVEYGTDPNNPDTDGDGYLDGLMHDCRPLDPNRWDCDDPNDTTPPDFTLLQPVSAILNP